MKKSVCVIGLGYIGLPTAALLANQGYEVSGVDLNEFVVNTINSGNIHIVEPDLDQFVRHAVESGTLKAFTSPKPADVFIICVPTPFHNSDSDGTPLPNVDYVMSAAISIAPFVKDGNLVILESTSPVGTTNGVSKMLESEGVDTSQIHIAYCPERVLPGKIMQELVQNDRVVGGMCRDSATEVAKFYRTFVRGEVLETDANTAEMCKLVENSYRDVCIAFANEISMLCSNNGVDVWNLIALANRHPRVNILQPGAGVGGHCIAVDPWFLVSADEKNANLIRSAREVNLRKEKWVVEQIEEVAKKFKSLNSKEPIITCFGLAFKPDIDDLRESPSLNIAIELKKKGYEIYGVEPNIESHEVLRILEVDEALNNSDILVLLVKHKQFLTFEFKSKIASKKYLDFCGATV